MIKIDVVKQRRKTVVLVMKSSDHAVLKVPTNFSKEKIDKFLSEKQAWLARASKKLSIRENFSENFDLENFLYIDGKPISPVKTLHKNFDNLSQEQKEKLVKKFYKEQFHILEKLAKEKSEETGLSYDALKPLTSTRTWGSYNIKRLMKLNYKLVILPKRLAEYVIYHELSHSKFMNHQSAFWKEVSKHCKDCNLLKKELQNFSFVLQKRF